MKTDAFVINMSFITLFYLLGTALVEILLYYAGYSLEQIVSVFYIMVIVSLVLAAYHIKKMIHVKDKTMNTFLIIVLIIMAILIAICAFGISKPWELFNL